MNSLPLATNPSLLGPSAWVPLRFPVATLVPLVMVPVALSRCGPVAFVKAKVAKVPLGSTLHWRECDCPARNSEPPSSTEDASMNRPASPDTSV